MGIFFCQGGVSANQVFSLSHKGELRREDLCCFADNNPGSNIKMISCNGNSNQLWNHLKVNKFPSNKNPYNIVVFKEWCNNSQTNGPLLGYDRR